MKTIALIACAALAAGPALAQPAAAPVTPAAERDASGVYQVFRMGYYAALVPNTALAKAAGGSRWSQGWYYLGNFVLPYGLYVPLAVFAAWLWLGRRRSMSKTFGTSARK